MDKQDQHNQLQEVLKLFKDLNQTDQYHPDCHILRIKYDDYSQTINNYFRTILGTNELSQRVFSLTSLIINNSATNYMAWFIRRSCIDNRTALSLDIDLEEECDWIDSITIPNQKNYQIWHHRKLLTELTGDYTRELRVIKEVFVDEPKNYHAWCHRIWVVRRYELYPGEMEFARRMLDRDVRNNSAWNFRFFLVSSMWGVIGKAKEKMKGGISSKEGNNDKKDSSNDCTSNSNKESNVLDEFEKKILDLEDKMSIDKEIAFSLPYIVKDPDNESVYSYISGLYSDKSVNHKGESAVNNDKLNKVIDDVTNQNAECYQVRSFKVELLVEERSLLTNKEKSTSSSNLITNETNKKTSNDNDTSIGESINSNSNSNSSTDNTKSHILALETNILNLFEDLKKIDYIRTKYWSWRKSNFKKTLQINSN